MLELIAPTCNMPDWASEYSRYWYLHLYDLALSDKLYDGIKHPFFLETAQDGRYVSMWCRKPIYRLCLPSHISDINATTLFGGDNFPKLAHDSKGVINQIMLVIKKSKLFTRMLELSYQGQAGSVFAACSVVNDKPSVTVWKSKYCWPIRDETGDLKMVMIAYTAQGKQFLGQGHRKDAEGNDIGEDSTYWSVRLYTRNSTLPGGVSVPGAIIGCVPILYSSWNPQTGNQELVKPSIDPYLINEHGLDFVPGVWIRNSFGGTEIDGKATFGSMLPTCIGLDFSTNQIFSGVHSASKPPVVIKGRVLNYDRRLGQSNVMNPHHVWQLPADKTEPGQGGSVSGADAFLLEQDGKPLDVGLNMIQKAKNWIHEGMKARSRDTDMKFPLSGKALELFDQDWVRYIKVQRTYYGAEGLIEIIRVLVLMLIALKSNLAKGLTEQHLDEIEPVWGDIYPPSPEELLPLTQAISTMIAAGAQPAVPSPDGKGPTSKPTMGVITPEEGRNWLRQNVDLDEFIDDTEEDPKPSDNGQLDKEASLGDTSNDAPQDPPAQVSG